MEKNVLNSLELSLGSEVFQKDFRISEEFSNRPGKKIAIFGGTNIDPESLYYKKATDLARLIAKSGISVVTGGGAGIMDAGNKGAKGCNSGSASYGLRVRAIHDEFSYEANNIDEDGVFKFDTLAVRLLSLIGVSSAVVFFPGGYGTLEELFSLLVRVKVGMMAPIPVYLFGSDFWSGLVSWINNSLLPQNVISSRDVNVFKVEDDIEKISQEIIKHCLKLK